MVMLQMRDAPGRTQDELLDHHHFLAALLQKLLQPRFSLTHASSPPPHHRAACYRPTSRLLCPIPAAVPFSLHEATACPAFLQGMSRKRGRKREWNRTAIHHGDTETRRARTGNGESGAVQL